MRNSTKERVYWLAILIPYMLVYAAWWAAGAPFRLVHWLWSRDTRGTFSGK